MVEFIPWYRTVSYHRLVDLLTYVQDSSYLSSTPGFGARFRHTNIRYIHTFMYDIECHFYVDYVIDILMASQVLGCWL
jgi:hypothetical protein